MSNETFTALLDFLESEAGLHFRYEGEEKGENACWDCDGTLTKTRAWCAANGATFMEGKHDLSDDHWPIIAGVRVHACCDCEVVFNGKGVP